MKLFNKVTALTSVLALTVFIQSVYSAEPEKFSDIPSGWAKEAVEQAVRRDIITGYEGRIYPEKPLTRAEMAAIINRTFKTIEKSEDFLYDDISEGDWFYEDMSKAVNMGAFSGNGGKLEPGRNITREEAFLVLSRVFCLKSSEEGTLNKFMDGNAVSDWARSGVAVMVDSGYVKGSEGYLRPADSVTRAEFAQLMFNMAGTVYDQPGNYDGSSPGNVLIAASGVVLENYVIKGDLILCDGIGRNDVSLNNMTVEGRLVIRGSSSDSVTLRNVTVKGGVVINNVNSIVGLKIEGSSSINMVEAETTALVDISEGSYVGKISVYADGTRIAGKGEVTEITVKANDVKVSTPNTKVTAISGSSLVFAGELQVAGGKTAIMNSKGTGAVLEGSTSSGSGSKGSSGSEPQVPEEPENPEEPQEPGEPETPLIPTDEDWTDVYNSGIVSVDFVNYAVLVLKLDAMEDADYMEYSYFLEGRELEHGKDVTQVLSLPTKNQLIVKVMLQNNARPQTIRLVKNMQYMEIELNGINTSIRK